MNEWGLFKGTERMLLEGEKSKDELEKLFQNQNQNMKEDVLSYAEKIEKDIFKLALLEYKTIQERY